MSWEEDARRVAEIVGVPAGQRLPAVSRQTLRHYHTYLDQRAHLSRKLRFHCGRNRSSWSTVCVEQKGGHSSINTVEMCALWGFLPHQSPLRVILGPTVWFPQ
jgi:hypothetical protein